MNMSLLGGLIFGAIFGGSAIKCAAENAECKKKIHYLPNGLGYWYDRKGSARLEDGTLIFISGNGEVENIHGEKIYSKTDEANKITRNKAMNNSFKYKYGLQYNIRTNQPVTTDLVSNKVIARVKKTIKTNGNIEYRKWYLYDECYEQFGKNAKYAIKVNPTTIKENDNGIVISEEEYNAICNCEAVDFWDIGSHKVMFEDETTGFKY